MCALPEDTVNDVAQKARRWAAAERDPRRWSWRIAADLYAPGFASEEKRQELVDRMHSAGFEFQMTNLNGDIRIPLSAMADSDIRARYLEVMG